MDPSLTSLPLEISTQIYRECLVDAIHGVEPQGKLIRKRTVKKKLHPNILRVSKLVYAQASTVLYEQNLFRFRYPYTCVTRGGQNLFSKGNPPYGKIERIKHVSVSHVSRTLVLTPTISQLEIAFNPDGYQHICDDAEEIMAVVDYIRFLRCSLRTLRLAFRLSVKPIGPDLVFTRAMAIVAKIISSSVKLINGVCALEVQNKIEIVIMRDSEEDFMLFERFAHRIGQQKQWAVTLEPRAKYDPHSWTWTLIPATVATKDKIPRADNC